MESQTQHHAPTLQQYIADQEHAVPFSRGEFSRMLRDISLSTRIVNREVNKAGLVDILGITGEINVQGEHVQKLDEFANQVFIETLSRGGQVCAVCSEENDDIVAIDNSDAKYVVMIDPLDGSSNIDVNVSVGTIFSICRRISESGPGTVADALQKGTEMLAAGYVVYGSSTMIVYTTGNGVNGFTLDPSIGEFLLSHPDMKIPDTCKTYSINEGLSRNLSPGIKAYLNHIKGESDPTIKPMGGRYIGSLVADFHRNLLKGGIFLYPGTSDAPNGKLRLLYEANPMAFLIEQAGGSATNGEKRIREIQPTELHQRTPLFIGNSAEIDKLHGFLKN